jgi:hypothetical protein
MRVGVLRKCPLAVVSHPNPSPQIQKPRMQNAVLQASRAMTPNRKRRRSGGFSFKLFSWIQSTEKVPTLLRVSLDKKIWKRIDFYSQHRSICKAR